MKNAIVILVVLLILALLIFGPLALLWSVGVVWGIDMSYDLKHWFAAFVLLLLFGWSSSGGRH